MTQVQQENATLRRELEEARGRVAGAAPTSAVAVDGDYANLQRQLTEASAQLNLLRSRYEHLQRRADSDREVLQRTQEELDDHARQARDLRHRVQRAEHERDAALAHKVCVSLGEASVTVQRWGQGSEADGMGTTLSRRRITPPRPLSLSPGRAPGPCARPRGRGAIAEG